MSFRLLNISSMYPGSLDSFYGNHPQIKNLSYYDHYSLLLSDSTEFAASYTRNFIKLGIDAACIIANDIRLQKKWRLENGLGSENNENVLLEQVRQFRPDILWIENLNYLNVAWFGRVKNEIKSIRLIIAYHCSPYSRSFLEKLKCADFVITCTPGLRADFENEGIRSYLVYHAFDKDLLTRLDKTNQLPEINLLFSGSLFPGGDLHNDRIRMIESILRENLNLQLYVNLEKQYKLKIKKSLYLLSRILRQLSLKKLAEKIPVFGYTESSVMSYSQKLIRSNHKPLFGIEMYNLFNRSGVVLNMHIGIAGEYAGNMRLFEVTGLGCCLLTDNKKNLGELFDTGNEVVTYDNTEDCLNKIKWLMGHEEERKRIALRGQQKTLQSHTVEERCKQIIDLINNELNSKIKSR
jgi:spore maturation protein CgeB